MAAPPVASALLTNGFIVLTLLVAAGVVWNVYLAGRGLRESHRRTLTFTAFAAAGIAAWLWITWQLAATGVLAQFDRRPAPILFLVLAVLILSTLVAFTRYGTRFAVGLPLWILVIGQVFRFPLELLMHRAASEGVMPAQMSYSGWNFDVATGILSIPVAWLLARGYAHARAIAQAWNALGILLLANILTVALLSTPVFAAFGPDRLNTWVAYPPFVWLPTMMVACAVTGHLVILRKLRATATRRP
jgi:hypothetical protein